MELYQLLNFTIFATSDLSHQRWGEGPKDAQVYCCLYIRFELIETGRRIHRCCTGVLGSLARISATRDEEKDPQILYRCPGVFAQTGATRDGELENDLQMLYKCPGVSMPDLSHQRWGEGPMNVVQVSWGLYPGFEPPETRRMTYRCHRCLDVCTQDLGKEMYTTVQLPSGLPKRAVTVLLSTL